MRKPSALAFALLAALMPIAGTPPRIGAADPPARDAFLDWRVERFTLDNAAAFIIQPGEDAAPPHGPQPWVLYAPTLTGHYPNEKDEGWMFARFLRRGIAVAGIDVGESYGSPAGRTVYSMLHRHLTTERGFDRKAVLLARSRGGLMLYNWAAEHPDKVRCIAGIYPVCNLRSYPGLDKACGAYGMTAAELEENLASHNPVDRLTGLADARVPVFHIHGDTDTVVPLETNSGLLAARYRELGGPVELRVATNQGHNMWNGFFECQDLVDFVVAHALPAPGSTPAPAEESAPPGP